MSSQSRYTENYCRHLEIKNSSIERALDSMTDMAHRLKVEIQDLLSENQQLFDSNAGLLESLDAAHEEEQRLRGTILFWQENLKTMTAERDRLLLELRQRGARQ